MMTGTPAAPTAHPATAYHRRQGPHMRNNDHAVLDQDLTSGRLQRKKGDALCRPSRQFWGLYPQPGRVVDCPRCLELAARHDITLTDPTGRPR